MSKDKVIVLDSGFVGYLFHPKQREFIKIWNQFIKDIDAEIILPAIIDYEFRRKCNFNKFKHSLNTLGQYRDRNQYLELTISDLDLAAELWAYCRSEGEATTDDKKIDIDVILIAQTISIIDKFSEVIIATSDPRDLMVFRNIYDFYIWDLRTALDDINRGTITFYKP